MFDGADFSGLDLSNMSLNGAQFYKSQFYKSRVDKSRVDKSRVDGRVIKEIIFFTGLYRYIVAPHVTDSGEHRIIMGCHNRSLAEWESDEWNNPSEFPNDNSEKSRARHFALGVAKQWLAEFAIGETAIAAAE